RVHADEITCHNIVVTAHEHQWVVRIAGETETLDGGTGTIPRQSTSRARTESNHLIVTRITDDLDQNDGVIANRERVRTCTRLRIAIDDHRLAESETKATRSAKAISKC